MIGIDVKRKQDVFGGFAEIDIMPNHADENERAISATAPLSASSSATVRRPARWARGAG